MKEATTPARRAAERMYEEGGLYAGNTDWAEKIITEETALRWTKTRPTEPGIYWTRSTHGFSDPTIVRVYEWDGKLFGTQTGTLSRHELDYFALATAEGVIMPNEWAGPIEVPDGPEG